MEWICDYLMRVVSNADAITSFHLNLQSFGECTDDGVNRLVNVLLALADKSHSLEKLIIEIP